MRCLFKFMANAPQLVFVEEVERRVGKVLKSRRKQLGNDLIIIAGFVIIGGILQRRTGCPRHIEVLALAATIGRRQAHQPVVFLHGNRLRVLVATRALFHRPVEFEVEHCGEHRVEDLKVFTPPRQTNLEQPVEILNTNGTGDLQRLGNPLRRTNRDR